MAAQRIRPRREPALLAALRRRSASFYAVVSLIAALLAAVIYTLIEADSPATLHSQVVHVLFDTPRGTNSVTLDWQIYKAPLAEARCTFTAIGSLQQVVGTATQVVGPNNKSKRTTNHSVVIPIQGSTQPVSASISSCKITRNH